MVKDSKNLIVGLDIGTSKIVAIVAEVLPDGALNVIGLGTQPSRGLKKGVVVNIETTMASIQRVLGGGRADGRLPDQGGLHGDRRQPHPLLFVARHGGDQGKGSDAGRHRPRGGDREGHPDSNDQQILHLLPQGFTIDGQEDVREPLGMSGVRLEVDVHIVTGAVSRWRT